MTKEEREQRIDEIMEEYYKFYDTLSTEEPVRPMTREQVKEYTRIMQELAKVDSMLARSIMEDMINLGYDSLEYDC